MISPKNNKESTNYGKPFLEKSQKVLEEPGSATIKMEPVLPELSHDKIVKNVTVGPQDHKSVKS